MEGGTFQYAFSLQKWRRGGGEPIRIAVTTRPKEEAQE
jgi:hypothetical protein